MPHVIMLFVYIIIKVLLFLVIIWKRPGGNYANYPEGEVGNKPTQLFIQMEGTKSSHFMADCVLEMGVEKSKCCKLNVIFK